MSEAGAPGSEQPRTVRTGGKGPLCCSFCGRDRSQVGKMISGPGVYICDACVGLCLEVLAGDLNQGVLRLAMRRADGSMETVEVAPRSPGGPPLVLCAHCGTWLVGSGIGKCPHCGTKTR